MYLLLKRIFSITLLLTLLSVAQVRAAGFTPGIGGLEWSPDGESLLYARKDGIFVIDLAGETRRIADAAPFDRSPHWSPDGQYIVSTIQPENQAGIFRTAVTGGEPEPLTEDVGYNPDFYAPNGTNPVYSPDGAYIAFLSNREGDKYDSLYVMTADGEDERRLSALGTVKSIVWLLNSQSIIFTVTLGGYNGLTDLFMADRDGENLRQLTDTQDVVGEYTPDVSPDGDHLLFTTSPDILNFVEQIDVDGENREVVLEDASNPDYSPDGAYIVFSDYSGNWAHLVVMNADGSDMTTFQLEGIVRRGRLTARRLHSSLTALMCPKAKTSHRQPRWKQPASVVYTAKILTIFL